MRLAQAGDDPTQPKIRKNKFQDDCPFSRYFAEIEIATDTNAEMKAGRGRILV
jgi:hypothetical protein